MKPSSWELDSEYGKKILNLNEPQIRYLAKTVGIASERLVRKTNADVKIDPLEEQRPGRKIWGRVVRYDTHKACTIPIGGVVIQIRDVQASFLGFFPREIRWSWFFPLFSASNVMKEVKTDSEGRFSFNIPHWDIERMLRYRRHRVALSEINRPTLRNILEGIFFLKRPNESVCLDKLYSPAALVDEDSLSQVQSLLGQDVSRLLRQDVESSELDDWHQPMESLLDVPLRSGSHPPLLEKCLTDDRRQTGEQLTVLHRSLADADSFDHVLDRYEGPFLRRRQSCLPEWLPIFDVPDIAFEVSRPNHPSTKKDVLYSGQFFDVSWTTGDIPMVTLVVDEHSNHR